MKSRKKISIGVFALVSLLSALFITAVPGNSVTAQDEPTPSADARLALRFTDLSTTDAVVSVSFASVNCEAPIGGTIYSDSEGERRVALGPANTAAVGVATHLNLIAESTEGGANADPCDYAITFTTNLNCTIAVVAGASDGVNANLPLRGGDSVGLKNPPMSPATVSVKETKTATLNLIGTSAVSDTDYFTDFEAQGPLAALFPVGSALGRLADRDAADTSVALTGQDGVFDGALGIAVTITDCDVPTVGNGVRVSNAEPKRSLASQVTITPASGCTAAEESVTNRSAGTQATFAGVLVSAVCTYGLSFGINLADADSPIVLEDNGLKSQCGIQATFYRRLTPTTSAVTIVSSSDTVALQFFAGELRFSLNDALITGGLTQITTYLSDATDCPSVGQARFTFETVGTVADAVASSTITVTITPATGSSPGCVATPASVPIKGAGEVATATLIVRPRAGRTCNYDIAYPLNEGALTLVYENGGKAAVPATDSVAAVAVDTDADGTFDGVVTMSARTLTSTAPNAKPVTAGYTTRNLPITVSMSFPDVEFTTSERVEYLITVVGACARFTPIIARALGQTGTYRGVQAYGGDTTVFDQSLADQEQNATTNVSGALLYEISPVIIVRDVPVSCTVQVDELSTPSGCSIVGGESRQVITFATGVKDFGFNFDHSCVGRVATTSGRSVTG